MQRHSVLFVCLGNICRSPLAEGVFRAALRRRELHGRFDVDSCGTGGWHAGEAPDPRSVATASLHGLDIAHQRARRLCDEDFQRFDAIVAMDRQNEQAIIARRPVGSAARVARYTQFAGARAPADVPDPYYGGDDGFETVYGLLERGADALIDAVLAGSGPWR
ncbi:MAG: low molecular weight phosphotyrosine protein phosphatase [Deltaproteobacteria bacterium]|nr:low molecular weight phosphotyrosine protein phosphatase [Deltaproteobacteria bacterium]